MSVLLKSAILTVYTEDPFGVYEDIDEILAYSMETLQLIDHIKLEVTRICNSGIINIIIKPDLHAIMEKICSWCDEEEIKLIFIIGCDLPYFSCKFSENDVAEMIEKIVNKEDFEKIASIISKIKMNLKSTFHRVICGVRKKTLIINLFGSYEEAAECCNVIVTTIYHEIDLRLKKKQHILKMQRLKKYSNNNPTNQVDGDKIKEVKEENSMTKDVDVNDSSSLEKTIDQSIIKTNIKRLKQSSPLSDESMEKTDNVSKAKRYKYSSYFSDESIEKAVDGHEVKYCEKLLSSSESNQEKMDVANENTISKEFSSLPDTIVKKLNIANQAIIDKASSSSTDIMTKELNIANQAVIDKESSSSTNIMTKLNIANQAIIDKAFSSSTNIMIKDELNIASEVVVDEESSSSPEMMKELNIASEVVVDEESSSSPEMMKELLNNANQAISDREYCSSPDITVKELNTTKQAIIDEESSSSEIANERDLEDIVPNLQYPMVSLDKALSIMRKVIRYNINERQYDKVKINNAHGRILCETVYSKCNVPAFRVSVKHGFAVLASDGEGIRTVLNGITSAPVSLKPGTCVWVKSGARIPDEATAVVPVKDTKRIINRSNMKKHLILIKIKPEFGQNIKDVGSDIRKEKLIIHPFTRIGPTELGLLAAMGRKEVIVATHVTVGILSIGDLLEEPENFLTPGYTYDSNRISVIALLKDKGFDSILDFGIVPDNMLLIITNIEEALNKVDVLVIIGCTSDNDRLKTILTGYIRATIHFGNVYIKPGKSTTFATYKLKDKTKYLLCLPRNPVSTLITAHLFLLPLLNGLHRIFENSHSVVPVCINQRYILHSRPRISWTVLKWNLEDNFARAFSKENLVSDKLTSSHAANALLILPQQTADLKVMDTAFVSALSMNFFNY